MDQKKKCSFSPCAIVVYNTSLENPYGQRQIFVDSEKQDYFSSKLYYPKNHLFIANEEHGGYVTILPFLEGKGLWGNSGAQSGRIHESTIFSIDFFEDEGRVVNNQNMLTTSRDGTIKITKLIGFGEKKGEKDEEERRCFLVDRVANVHDEKKPEERLFEAFGIEFPNLKITFVKLLDY